jgi:hypothetical protein
LNVSAEVCEAKAAIAKAARIRVVLECMGVGVI